MGPFTPLGWLLFGSILLGIAGRYNATISDFFQTGDTRFENWFMRQGPIRSIGAGFVCFAVALGVVGIGMLTGQLLLVWQACLVGLLLLFFSVFPTSWAEGLKKNRPLIVLAVGTCLIGVSLVIVLSPRGFLLETRHQEQGTLPETIRDPRGQKPCPQSLDRQLSAEHARELQQKFNSLPSCRGWTSPGRYHHRCAAAAGGGGSRQADCR